MKIALIYPSFGVVSVKNQPNIKAVADNYGIYPNMSMAYVAGTLQKAGHDLIFLDAMASGYSLEDMQRLCNKFSPEIIMFTLTTYLFHETLDVIRYFKKTIKTKVIVGGAHLELYPKETLMNKEIDFGIIGEAEETVVELVNAIDKKLDFAGIKGICYRKNEHVIISPKREKIKDLDKVAFPARNLLPMDKYYSFISKYRNYTIMITSRGCTFSCNFCEQRTGDIRYRSAINVVDEMEECYVRYGVREIDIFDPLFTLNKKRVLEICSEIRKRRLKIHWSCRSRVDTIDYEMLRSMKSAGCYRIYYGIESGDEVILKNIKKFTTIAKIKSAINLTKREGILAFGYFMFGCPGETEATIKKTIKLALSLPLDYAQFSRLSILPGTGLYADVEKKVGADYWKKYIIDKKNEKSLPRINCALTDEQLDKYIRKAYLKFYMRPGFILKTILQIRSMSELLRYFKAGLGMIVSK
ncbi:MAG: radical SAM protein [archaeon]